MEFILWIGMLIFGASMTLSVLAARARKSNQLLKEIAEANTIRLEGRYSPIGVGLKGNESVAKCPWCSEWVNIEAQICRFCGKDVSKYLNEIKQSMELIDNQIKLEQEKVRAAKEKQRLRRVEKVNKPFVWLSQNRFARGIGIFLIASTVTYILYTSITSMVANSKIENATQTYKNRDIVRTAWESHLDFCLVKDVFEVVGITPTFKEGWGYSGGVYLKISYPSTRLDFDWNSQQGKAIECFAQKAFGISASEKFGNNVETISINGRELIEVKLPHRTTLYSGNEQITFQWYKP